MQDEDINHDIINKLLSLKIGTKDECMDAYLATDNKTDIESMKEYILNINRKDSENKPNPLSFMNHTGSKEDNMTDSYTDDIKENILENMDSYTDDDGNIINDNNEDIELLPVGLLPKYEQKSFIMDEETVQKRITNTWMVHL